MSNLVSILKLKYPDIDFRTDVILHDDGDGPYIKHWNINSEMPDADTLQQWETESETLLIFVENKKTNKEIYDQLEKLDLQSIRALREKNEVKIAEIELQAEILRSQLLPVG